MAKFGELAAALEEQKEELAFEALTAQSIQRLNPLNQNKPEHWVPLKTKYGLSQAINLIDFSIRQKGTALIAEFERKPKDWNITIRDYFQKPQNKDFDYHVQKFYETFGYTFLEPRKSSAATILSLEEAERGRSKLKGRYFKLTSTARYWVDVKTGVVKDPEGNVMFRTFDDFLDMWCRSLFWHKA